MLAVVDALACLAAELWSEGKLDDFPLDDESGHASDD
jgi:hypothetical protein